ncbi:MAG: AtpZ/AtpI family protein [Clostridium sp.]|nr:AtpZ/AtpI family protein [Clostridium sp.]
MGGTDESGQKNSKGSAGHKRNDGRVLEALALVMQFGIHMIVPIFMCLFLGLWIDRKAGTSYWVIILFFMGALAGFTNIYKLARKIYGRDSGRRGKGADRDGNGKQDEEQNGM